MSKVTFERIYEAPQPIDIDVSQLYSTVWIDVSLCAMLVFVAYKIIKSLK